jgi:hypothetical protein
MCCGELANRHGICWSNVYGMSVENTGTGLLEDFVVNINNLKFGSLITLDFFFCTLL